MKGDKIKEYRLKRRLTQDELSQRVGIDRTHLSKIETGKVKPSLSLLERIAKELGVAPRNFF
jgi:transcriptional regulator with XRE-family HTH domain